MGDIFVKEKTQRIYQGGTPSICQWRIPSPVSQESEKYLATSFFLILWQASAACAEFGYRESSEIIHCRTLKMGVCAGVYNPHVCTLFWRRNVADNEQHQAYSRWSRRSIYGNMPAFKWDTKVWTSVSAFTFCDISSLSTGTSGIFYRQSENVDNSRGNKTAPVRALQSFSWWESFFSLLSPDFPALQPLPLIWRVRKSTTAGFALRGNFIYRTQFIPYHFALSCVYNTDQ